MAVIQVVANDTSMSDASHNRLGESSIGEVSGEGHYDIFCVVIICFASRYDFECCF